MVSTMNCFENSEKLTDCMRGGKIKCEHIHESFLELFEDAIGKNIAAKRSFINWLEKTPPTPSYLSGPLTLTKHTFKADTKKGWSSDFCVYIFGERHGERGCKEWKEYIKLHGVNDELEKTMEIQDFLLEVADTSPVFLDIFIEMQRPSKKYEKFLEETDTMYGYKYFIHKIRNIFRQKMAYIDDKTIKFERMENVRVHAIDERHVHTGGFLWEFYDTNFKAENLDDKEVAQKFINSIGEFMLNKFDPKKFITNYYLNDKIIAKELFKLDDIQRKNVLDYIIESWEERNETVFYGAQSYFKHHMRLSNPLDKTEMINLYNYFSSTRMLFMVLHVDIYFLSRFLKGFDSMIEPHFPYNSIVYTGYEHSTRYRNFFSKLGFTSENLTQDNFVKINDDFEIHSSECMKINEKKMYPMFGVKSCGY